MSPEPAFVGDGCSWRDRRKTKKKATQCYAPAVGFISKGGKMLHSWNKNQGHLILAGRMLPAKTQLKLNNFDMFWLGFTIDKSDKYGNLGVGRLWWSHHSESLDSVIQWFNGLGGLRGTAAAKHRFGAAVMEGTLLRGRWLQDAGIEILSNSKVFHVCLIAFPRKLLESTQNSDDKRW